MDSGQYSLVDNPLIDSEQLLPRDYDDRKITRRLSRELNLYPENNQAQKSLRGQRQHRKLKLDVGDFVILSRHMFCAKAIEAMEMIILFALDWKLNPPTPLRYISSMVRLIPKYDQNYNNCYNANKSFRRHQSCQHHQYHTHLQLVCCHEDGNRTGLPFVPQQQWWLPLPHKVYCRVIFEVARYLSELSACVSAFSFYSKNSIVAYASMLCAMEMFEAMFSPSMVPPASVRENWSSSVAVALLLGDLRHQSGETLSYYNDADCVCWTKELLKRICPSLEEQDVFEIMRSEMDAMNLADATTANSAMVSPTSIARNLYNDYFYHFEK